MATKKSLSLKIGARTYHIVTTSKAPGAELALSDQVSGGSCSTYNNPGIYLRFGWVGMADWEYPVTIHIRFQRNLCDGSSAYDKVPSGADWYMVTERKWGECYAGEIELSRDSGKIELTDRPFTLSGEDELRVKVARLIAKTIAQFNLTYVHKDECARTIAALDAVGVYVTRNYYTSRRDSFGNLIAVSLDEARTTLFTPYREPKQKLCVKCDAVITTPVLAAGERERCASCADVPEIAVVRS